MLALDFREQIEAFVVFFSYRLPENRQELHMRFILLSGAAFAALMIVSLNISAQGADTDQYCVQIHGNQNTLRCGYETLGACQLATNSG
jgi:hypothetical protein